MLEPGIAKDALVTDLSAVGSLAGGGDLGDVDLVYVPEPNSMALSLLDLLFLACCGSSPRFHLGW